MSEGKRGIGREVGWLTPDPPHICNTAVKERGREGGGNEAGWERQAVRK